MFGVAGAKFIVDNTFPLSKVVTVHASVADTESVVVVVAVLDTTAAVVEILEGVRTYFAAGFVHFVTTGNHTDATVQKEGLIAESAKTIGAILAAANNLLVASSILPNEVSLGAAVASVSNWPHTFAVLDSVV